MFCHLDSHSRVPLHHTIEEIASPVVANMDAWSSTVTHLALEENSVAFIKVHPTKCIPGHDTSIHTHP